MAISHRGSACPNSRNHVSGYGRHPWASIADLGQYVVMFIILEPCFRDRGAAS